MEKQDLIFEMICDDSIYYIIDLYDVNNVEHMESLMEHFKPNFSKYGLNVEEVTYEDLVKATKEAQTYIGLDDALQRFEYEHPDATDGEISEFVAWYLGN